MPVILPVIQQHAEEAAILWIVRDEAVRAPHYSLKDLDRFDDRVDAHLDGLRIAGDPGWEILKASLEQGESGEVFASAALAFEKGDAGRIREVLEIGSTNPEKARGLVSALGWIPLDQAWPHIQQLLTNSSPVLRRVGLASAAIHRQDPGPALAEALFDSDPALRARAFRALGELGRSGHPQAIQKGLASEDPSCRFWAAWASTLLAENPQGLAILRQVAEQGGRLSEPAVQLAMRRMPPSSAKSWRVALGENPKTLRLGIVAAGALGDPEAIPWLIEQMTVPEVARVAGEAFSMITGVDLAYEDLDTNPPEGFQAGPTEDPEDENVAMDPDENLPWPHPSALKKDWDARKSRFSTGNRYLLGEPIQPESLRNALRNGYQRQRAAAALELAILQPGQPLFEVRAPAFRQQRWLDGTGSRPSVSTYEGPAPRPIPPRQRPKGLGDWDE